MTKTRKRSITEKQAIAKIKKLPNAKIKIAEREDGINTIQFSSSDSLKAELLWQDLTLEFSDNFYITLLNDGDIK